MTPDDATRQAVDAVQAEARMAADRYGPFTSTHEGLGVLLEEFRELQDAVRSNVLESVQREAEQVAAVALRLAMQCRYAIGNAYDTPFSKRSVP